MVCFSSGGFCAQLGLKISKYFYVRDGKLSARSQHVRILLNADGSRNFKFTLGQEEVIPGLELGILGDEGVPPIRTGGTRTLLIPPELAYGARGDNCLFGLDEKCRVPPNSPVEIIVKFEGTNY